jgi:signal transduction histidine kinase
MLDTYIELISLLCHVWILIYVIRFFRHAYSRWSWFVISLPIFFMLIRRILNVYWMFVSGNIESSYPIPEAFLSLSVSLVTIIAFVYIKHLFVHIRVLLDREKENVEHLEAQVKERTTQLHTTYKNMLRAKTQWDKTFDAVPDLISILDTNHRIIRANKAFAEAVHTTPEELVGKLCYNIVHSSKEPPAFCPALKTFKTFSSEESQATIPKLNGEFIVSTHPIFSKKGVLAGCVHIARDVTNFLDIQGQLEFKKNQLHKLEIAKTEDLLISARALNAGIAHELRTPLQAILNSLELLYEGVSIAAGKTSDLIDTIDKEDLPKFIDGAKDRVEYSLKILNSLSAYAKAGTSKNIHLINVVDEVELVIKTLQLTDKFKSLDDMHFNVEYACEGGCLILINRSDFMQVLINLCNNAAEAVSHTDPKITISIECGQAANEVIINVIDNGSGISEDIGNTLFEPYFSTKASRPDGVTNHGLGLAIVKNIILTYSGKISYKSKPGHTVFTVVFPCEKNGTEEQNGVHSKEY